VCEVGREDGCEEDEEKGEEVSSKHIILEMGLKKNIIIIIIKFYIKNK
jgi:hypothetical protein